MKKISLSFDEFALYTSKIKDFLIYISTKTIYIQSGCDSAKKNEFRKNV